MKIMVASDLHGSALYTEKLFEAFEQEQPERLLLLGDLLIAGFFLSNAAANQQAQEGS